MRILFFASDYKIGLSSLLTDELIALGKIDCTILSVAGESQQEDHLERSLKGHHIDLIRIHGLDEHKHFMSLRKNISNIVKEHNIDILHVQNNWQLALAAACKIHLLHKKRLKTIYTVHGFRNNHPIKSIIARIVIGLCLFLLADKIIFPSQYLKRIFNFLSYKGYVLPLGINDHYFFHNLLPSPKDKLRLIFPAQFRKGKNQDMIIRAFADFLNRRTKKDAMLCLPGLGELREECISLAKKLEIEKNVVFPGLLSKEKIKDLYIDSNVAIVASNSETFGQSIVEPFVLGRCVVSRYVGVAQEIIKEDVNGFIYKDQKELTDILLKLENNIELLKQIEENNFGQRSKFSWANIAYDYFDNIVKPLEQCN